MIILFLFHSVKGGKSGKFNQPFHNKNEIILLATQLRVVMMKRKLFSSTLKIEEKTFSLNNLIRLRGNLIEKESWNIDDIAFEIIVIYVDFMTGKIDSVFTRSCRITEFMKRTSDYKLLY